MIHEEEKYREIIRLLNSLPRVKAKKGFEARLMERLRRQEDIVKTQVTEESVFNKFLAIFKPSFIQAVAVSAVILIAVIVYFSYFTSNSETTAISDPHKTEHLIYLRSDKDSYFSSKANTDLSMNNTGSFSDKLPKPDYDNRLGISSPSTDSPLLYYSSENKEASDKENIANYNTVQEITMDTESESRDKVISRNENIGTDKKEKNTMVYDEIGRSGLLPLAKAQKPKLDSSKQDSTKKNQKDKKLKEEPEK